MLQVMIYGAAIAGGAFLAHKMFKWAKQAFRSFLKRTGLKKKHIKQAFIVFSDFVTHITTTLIVLTKDGQLTQVDQRQSQQSDIPKEQRNKLKARRNQLNKERSMLDKMRGKRNEEPLHAPVAVELSQL